MRSLSTITMLCRNLHILSLYGRLGYVVISFDSGTLISRLVIDAPEVTTARFWGTVLGFSVGACMQ